LFSLTQAIACADAKAQLISPFVGRITDWHKKNNPDWQDNMSGTAMDPGVQSVKSIYQYYKKFGISTEVMGASFRNIGQIQELSGCDLLTISPELLAELQKTQRDLSPSLTVAEAQSCSLEEIKLNEADFRYALNADAMANDKLSEGIRLFCADIVKLEDLLNN
jgi:transaldolase